MTRKQEIKSDLNLIKMYQKQSTTTTERLAYLKLQIILKTSLIEGRYEK